MSILGIGIGIGFNRGGAGAGVGLITGTGPVLASLVNGVTLSTAVTWGSYSGTGAVTATKQMKLNAGSWVAYVGGTVVNTGEMWTVRELCSDTLVTDQPFTSGFQIVIATALAPSTFGIGDWVVNPTMTTGSATFTIYTLPNDNGSALTALQYRIGAGSWVSFGGLTVGNYAVTGLTDGVQNSMTIRAVNAIGNGTASAAKFVTSQTSAALVTGNSATIVSGGVTWTLSSARDYGITDTGIVTVDWTSGLQVLSRSPAATTDGGYTVNGTMKNPVRNVQGWHSGTGDWSAGTNIGFPFSVADNDIVVGAIHQPGGYSDIRFGVNASYSGLYFKAGGLPVNAVAPALIGWTGRGTPAAYSLNIVDVAASMPAYSLTGIPYPTVANVLTQVDRLEVALAVTEEDATDGYESLLTYALGDGTSNYGQWVARWYGAAGLHLCGDVATAGQKQSLLKALVRHGVQWYDNVAGDGNVPRAYGGHFQFHTIPVAMALHYLARGTLLDTLPSVFPGNQFNQTITYDSGRIADLLPHSNTSKPLASRRRTLSGVSGLNMSVSTDRTSGIGDLARTTFIGMLLVRESDGKTAMIDGMPSGTDINAGVSTKAITIDVQPSPSFANSDVVYTRRPATIYENDLDWRERATEWAINPSPTQEYRNLNKFSDDVLALRSQGIWRDTWPSLERYTALANRVGDPTLIGDYPSHHDSVGGFNFAEGFWNTYAATVLGSYPVIVENVTISGSAEDGTVVTAVPAVVAPSAGLVRTYQWYNNLVAIGGETASTYTIVTGDVGDSISVWETIVNAKGTQISRSAGVVAISGYTPNAVQTGVGVAYGYSSGLSGMPASTQGSFVFTFRKRNTWQSGTSFFHGTNAAGTARFTFTQQSTGRIEITLRNAATTIIGNWITSNSEFAVGTYYTVAISWDTVTQVWVARKRPDGGSWSTITPASSFLTLNETTEAIGRLGVATTNAAGVGAPTDLDMHDIWLDFGQKPDFTSAPMLASFLPTVSKGSNGSLPTGSAPHFFFSGAAASWVTNDGAVGGLALTGTFVDASAQPT